MMVGGGEQVATVDVPALAAIARRINETPHYLLDRPMAVDERLWHQASHEMEQLMDARGWPVPVADIDEPNFLFRGIVIVMEG